MYNSFRSFAIEVLILDGDGDCVIVGVFIVLTKDMSVRIYQNRVVPRWNSIPSSLLTLCLSRFEGIF